MIRAGLIQLTSSDDPAENLPVTLEMVREARSGGADFILTPEVTNCVSASRKRQEDVLRHEAEDQTLSAMRALAEELGAWVLIGSLALKSDTDDRFVNRSFLLTPDGGIRARYDKIHMFDVTLSETETYRESAGYRPGKTAVITKVANTDVGMTICYDVRFPRLYRKLAQAGANVLTVPSAFSPDTGPAHWSVLLRARAIECGAYVLAPAQTGQHTATKGRSRRTYGHSMAIDPWGEVLADAGTAPGVIYADIDPAKVTDARRRLPSLTHDREFEGP